MKAKIDHIIKNAQNRTEVKAREYREIQAHVDDLNNRVKKREYAVEYFDVWRAYYIWYYAPGFLGGLKWKRKFFSIEDVVDYLVEEGFL